MHINIKTESKEELIEKASFICYSDDFKNKFFELLRRNDAKEILDASFKSFVINAPDIFFEIINMEKYNYLFDDLINKYIRIIINHAVKQENPKLLFKFIPKYNDIMIDNFDVVLNNKPFFAEDVVTLCNKNVFDKGLIKFKDLFIENIIETFNINNDNNIASMNFVYYSNMMAFLHFIDIVNNNDFKEVEDKCVQIWELILRKVKTVFIDTTNNGPAKILNQISKMARRSDKINSILEENFDFILEIFTDKRIDTLKSEEIYDFFKAIFKNIMKDENVSLKDISYAKGRNSMVAIIGNKVIKTGNKFAKKVPYHRRFLQPIVRTNIDYISPEMAEFKGKISLSFFEVYERVDTKKITKDDAYMVFKEMLYDNILWTDPNYENLGRLLKPNLPYNLSASVMKNGEDNVVDNDKQYYVDDYAVGFIGESKKQILSEGNLVIPDLDCAYEIKSINVVDTIRRLLIDNPEITPEEVSANLLVFYKQETGEEAYYGKYFNRYLKCFMDELKKDIEVRNKYNDLYYKRK